MRVKASKRRIYIAKVDVKENKMAAADVWGKNYVAFNIKPIVIG